MNNLGNRLTWAFYAASVAVFLVLVAWGFFILTSAAGIADRTDHDNKAALVKNEIARQVELLARDQSQISNWDDTIKAISGDLDETFIRREIAGWLWEDFDIQDSVIVGPSGKALATVHRSKMIAPAAGQKLIEQNQRLIDETTRLYFEGRKQTRNGFTFPDDPTRLGTAIYAQEFRIVNGELGLYLAQAIVPSDGLTLPDGKPHVLLTHKPLPKATLNAMKDKLGLLSFYIAESSSVVDPTFSEFVSETSNLRAVWNAEKLSTTIWYSSIPLIVSMMVFLSGAIFVFSVSYGRALTKLKESDSKNAFLALHDGLTGLPNRAKLDRTLQQLVDDNLQETAAILCMDLDHFKSINDAGGHHVGDGVLQAVAERSVATVGDSGMVARIGGDEFVIVVFGSKQGPELLQMCDRLVSTISQPIDVGGVIVTVGASIGVSRWTDPVMSASEVIRNADQALYRVKKSGRGRTDVENFPNYVGVSEGSNQRAA